MKTVQKNLSEGKNEKNAASVLNSNNGTVAEGNPITDTKNTTKMKAKSKAAAKPVPASKKAVPGKPAPKSIKRDTAEKAKLTIVKGSQDAPGVEKKGGDDSAKSLQSTLRVVDDLSRKVKLRGAIIDTLDAVEAFSFKQESNEGGYNGCCVQFMDDNRNKWEIRDLDILSHLVEEAKAKCRGKLEDIEKTIRLPKSAA